MYIYFQNPTALRSVYTKAQTDVPMLFNAFKYNPGFLPPAMAAQVGNLVSYRSKFARRVPDQGLVLIRVSLDHDFGGHFAGLDNPPALMEDLREIGKYWV